MQTPTLVIRMDKPSLQTILRFLRHGLMSSGEFMWKDQLPLRTEPKREIYTKIMILFTTTYIRKLDVSV